MVAVVQEEKQSSRISTAFSKEGKDRGLHQEGLRK